MEVSINSGAVEALVASYPQEIYSVFRGAVEVSTLAVQRKVTNNFGTGRDKLKVRSGKLRNSLVTIVEGSTINTLIARVQAGGGAQRVKYAVLQEKGTGDLPGGAIKPKNGKYANVEGGPYLNIPLRDNKTPSGVMRKNAQQVFAEGGTIFKSRTGKWFVKSAQGQLMFILVKSVKFKGRLGMFKAKNEQIPLLMSDIQEGVVVLLNQ